MPVHLPRFWCRCISRVSGAGASIAFLVPVHLSRFWCRCICRVSGAGASAAFLVPVHLPFFLVPSSFLLTGPREQPNCQRLSYFPGILAGGLRGYNERLVRQAGTMQEGRPTLGLLPCRETQRCLDVTRNQWSANKNTNIDSETENAQHGSFCYGPSVFCVSVL